MELVGRVADGPTETSAKLILLKDIKDAVKAEEFLLTSGSNAFSLMP